MRTFAVFGVRVLSERSWVAEVATREALRFDRDALVAKLAKLVVEGRALDAAATKAAAQAHQTRDKVRAAIQTVMACNIGLTHRIDQVEAENETLRSQLCEALRS